MVYLLRLHLTGKMQTLLYEVVVVLIQLDMRT
jgi:hypothetical protein